MCIGADAQAGLLGRCGVGIVGATGLAMLEYLGRLELAIRDVYHPAWQHGFLAGCPAEW